ncbi:YcgN family cysteine cluster protein [Alphaproteobacteria bacterium KMM 3653]|uniref:UPF0260 protein IV417_01880 n=1 Tax=Harenicola maris TaxID=2841044 RepID=A0AAP2CKI0_9RHOB|nr:YcgN family cysteine cluster protein [Harenicola maris]
MTRPRFWETVPLAEMTKPEWEALCDGCGKCCLNKLEDEDSGEVAYTRIGCRLLDCDTCLCSNYEGRKAIVPECIILTPETLPDAAYFMPLTCAYRRLHEGKALPEWHPLITGDPESTHKQGGSLRGLVVPETDVPVDDWENYLLRIAT